MSEAVRVEPTIVILPSATWASELEAELIRAGISADQAPRTARHILHRVCAHHGWPREVIEVAGAAADDQLDTGSTVTEAAL